MPKAPEIRYLTFQIHEKGGDRRRVSYELFYGGMSRMDWDELLAGLDNWLHHREQRKKEDIAKADQAYLEADRRNSEP